MESFSKMRSAITSMLAKFQISSWKYRGYYISGTATLTAMMQPAATANKMKDPKTKVPPHHSHPHYCFINKNIINVHRQNGNASTVTPWLHKTRIKQAEKTWKGRTSYSFSSFSFPFHGHPAGLNTKPATRAEELLVSKQPSISGANCICGHPHAVAYLSLEVGGGICTPTTTKHTVVCVVVVLRCRPPDESPQVNLRRPFGGVSGMSNP